MRKREFRVGGGGLVGRILVFKCLVVYFTFFKGFIEFVVVFVFIFFLV